MSRLLWVDGPARRGLADDRLDVLLGVLLLELFGIPRGASRSPFAIFVKATVNGALDARKMASGPDSLRRILSARLIASIFGTCSPIEMWIEVTST